MVGGGTGLKPGSLLEEVVRHADTMATVCTVDGFEKTIGVNYLGHFLLTELLLDFLKNSAPSRMAIVSSVVHAGRPTKRPKIHFDDLHYRKRVYRAFDAYAEAKLADVLYAEELAERLRDTGVSVFSVHPGWA